MNGPGLGGAAAQFLYRLPGFEQLPLRLGEALVGHTLFLLQGDDRGARFLLPLLQCLALILRLAPFTGQLVTLEGHLGRILRRALQLGLETDDRLFLTVLLCIQRSNRLRRLRDDTFQFRSLSAEPCERLALALDPGTKILDLALGLEDAT